MLALALALALPRTPGGGNDTTAASIPTGDGGSPRWQPTSKSSAKAGVRRGIAATIPHVAQGARFVV
jgi:hypothetical protein